MRWDALFADLEGEAEAEAEADQRSEVSDRIRAELGRLRLIDRLSPLLAEGGSLRIRVAGHEPLLGGLQGIGADWLLLGQDGGGEILVPLAAVQWMQGLGRSSAEPGWEGAVGARLTVRVALRRIVRDRSLVNLALSSGDALSGRLARVGADHVELEPAAKGQPGDSPATRPHAVPITAIAFVQRR